MTRYVSQTSVINKNRLDKGLYWQRAWSLVSGCSPVSPGCRNCWSARETHMREFNPNEKIRLRNQGLTDGLKFNGVVRFNEDLLYLPSRIKKPTVFSVWNDLFHRKVSGVDIVSAFLEMELSPRHQFLLLTKRIDRAGNFFHQSYFPKRNNLWIGTTAEDQEWADKRIPVLLSIPGIKRFVNLEPLLGPVKFRWAPYFWQFTGMTYREYLEKNEGVDQYESLKLLDGVIVGGESGPKARPCKPEWIRSIIEQCRAADVKCFVKQLGANDGIQRHRSKRADEETIREVLGECPRELPWN